MIIPQQVVLGVGGGIAAYRAAELTRLLLREAMQVDVVMTKAAQQFVAPLTFAALSNRHVHSDVFGLSDGEPMGHIRLVRQADVVIVAPCTADLLAKLAHGIADDLLTTLIAARADTAVLLAPAMNPAMWSAAANQRNVMTLREQGMMVIPPDCGDMACGEQGAGRLPSPAMLLEYVRAACLPRSLAGQRWVINAGPTVEAWDAVRVLTNRASGRLGATLATQAAMMGAQVTLVAGPGVTEVPSIVHRVDVVSANDMLQSCVAEAKDCDVFIATAAVSDYAFAYPSAQKLKRGEQTGLHVELRNNPDVVSHIAHMRHRPRHVIAFAAESRDHCQYARAKLEKKGVDAIIANDVSHMGGDDASGWWLTAKATQSLQAGCKLHFSHQIISRILEL